MSTSDQPTGDSTGLPLGTEELASLNFRSAAKSLRSSITKTFTKATTCIGKANEYLVDPLAKRTFKDLATANGIRQELVRVHSMLESDAHFWNHIRSINMELSNAERLSLRTVVSDKLSERHDRKDVVEKLELAAEGLASFLADHDFSVDSPLSPDDRRDISESLSRLDEEEDDASDQEHDRLFLSSIKIDEDKREDQVHESPILLQDNVPTVTYDTVRPLTTATTGGAVPARAFAQLSVCQPTGTLHHVKEDHPRMPTRIYKSVDKEPTRESDSDLCPVCKGSHPIVLCEHPKRKMYLVSKGWCSHCTSDAHRTRECELSEPVPSLVPSPEDNDFMVRGTPENFSTPRDSRPVYDHPHPDWKQETRLKATAKVPTVNTRVRTPKTREVLEPSDSDEELLAIRKHPGLGTGMLTSEHLVPEFNGDPLKYHEFIRVVTDLVLENERLPVALRWMILEKKITGKAKPFVVRMINPADSIHHTLTELENKYDEGFSLVKKELIRFRDFTFHETDLERASEQLIQCKALIWRLRDLGEDVNSFSFVRPLIEKLPEKMVRNLRASCLNTGYPPVDVVLQKFENYLKDRTFSKEFLEKSITKRTKELAPESVMIAGASSPASVTSDRIPAATPSSQGPIAVNVTLTSTNPSPAQGGNTQSATGGVPSTEGFAPKKQNKPKGGNQQRQQSAGNPGNNNSTSGPPKRNPGNQNTQSVPSLQNQVRFTVEDDTEAVSPTLGHTGRLPPVKNRGIPGEHLEPCYKFGRGYDRRFIAHTFPLTEPCSSKCCFICGPGHSILQCSLPSYEVRQYLRSTKSCHNCAQRDHTTANCPSYSTCAYCQGGHNSGGCTLKEFYRNMANYPSDAPTPVVGTFFRGPLGGSE